MNESNRANERNEILIVDALGPSTYANKIVRILTSDDSIYYTKAGAWVKLSSPAIPTAHHTTHEDGGSDEISVTGLSGLLADKQKVGVRKNSAGTVFVRQQLNFIEGTNVTLTIADDAGTPEIDITINAASGSGPTPTIVGQVQISLDGSTFVAKLPVTDPAVGWLVDGTSGLMMVV